MYAQADHTRSNHASSPPALMSPFVEHVVYSAHLGPSVLSIARSVHQPGTIKIEYLDFVSAPTVTVAATDTGFGQMDVSLGDIAVNDAHTVYRLVSLDDGMPASVSLLSLPPASATSNRITRDVRLGYEGIGHGNDLEH